MRVLALSWRGPDHPLAGGAEQVMHEHMKGWVGAGHSVTLFTSAYKGCRQIEEKDGVRIIRRGRQILGVHMGAFWYYLFGEHGKYDLVVDQFHGVPFLTPLYVRVPKLAVVQEVARKVWLTNELPKPFNWIVGWIGFLGEPVVYFFYRGVTFMTGSESAKKDLMRMGISEKRVTVVPHGTLIVRPKPFPKKEKMKTVMFLGAITRDKGIDDVLGTFRELVRRGDYQFWVVGKAGGPYLEKMRRFEKEMRKERFTYYGFVSQEKKFELLARAHVVINPSVLEGFGLVNIEANAMGTPVVAYRSQGLVDSVKAGVSGIFCSENTPREMAAEVEKLLGSSDRLASLSKSAQKWSEKFTWERSIEESRKLIRKVT